MRLTLKAGPFLAGLLLAVLLTQCRGSRPMHQGDDHALVALSDVDATILHEMRYAGADNFIGRPIAGYERAACLLSEPAARALSDAQAEARAFGMSLKVFDCYRPQRAVDDFVRWSLHPADTVMKQRFYPDVEKSRLFEEGYIAERSGHSRGSTVDLTLVETDVADSIPVARGDCRYRTSSGAELDMGTAFDCFDPLSHTGDPSVPPAARRNRLLLRLLMERHGFVNYSKEWWHFGLRDEPYPDTYIDVPVR